MLDKFDEFRRHGADTDECCQNRITDAQELNVKR